MYAGVAEIGCILHLLFIHDALSELVDQKVRLHEDVRDALRQLVDAFEVRSLLDADRNLRGACFPCHLDAVADIARNCEIEHVDAKGKAGFFLDEIRVRAAAAAADDRCLAGDGDFLAVLVKSEDSADLAVLILQDFLARSLKQNLDAQFLSSRIKGLVHEGSRARADALVCLYDMPCRFGLCEILVRSLEFHAHVLEPFNGLG